jgi:hypothetical protein
VVCLFRRFCFFFFPFAFLLAVCVCVCAFCCGVRFSSFVFLQMRFSCHFTVGWRLSTSLIRVWVYVVCGCVCVCVIVRGVVLRLSLPFLVSFFLQRCCSNLGDLLLLNLRMLLFHLNPCCGYASNLIPSFLRLCCVVKFPISGGRGDRFFSLAVCTMTLSLSQAYLKLQFPFQSSMLVNDSSIIRVGVWVLC